jgi:hypothetical protein
MKIHTGKGTPIWVSARDNGDGVMVFQGGSRLMLSSAEIGPFIAALQAITTDTEPTNDRKNTP